VILHRDLKPDNVLLTALLSAKVSDFGTSRAKALADDVAMTAVGTPLYCAPEISRGDVFDEKVDVYSFGLLLLSVAIDESIIDFLSDAWTRDFGKKATANKTKTRPPPFRKVLARLGEGWRPNLEATTTTTTTARTTGPPSLSSSHPAGGAASGAPFIPPAVAFLVAMCWALDPAARPAFPAVLAQLSGAVKADVGAGAWPRRRGRHGGGGGRGWKGGGGGGGGGASQSSGVATAAEAEERASEYPDGMRPKATARLSFNPMLGNPLLVTPAAAGGRSSIDIARGPATTTTAESANLAVSEFLDI